MKLRAQARRLKWAASKHPAMRRMPPGSWFVELPSSWLPDLSKRGVTWDYGDESPVTLRVGYVGKVDGAVSIATLQPAITAAPSPTP